MKVLNIKAFINKANAIHKNKFDYSRSVYFNVNTPLEIICHEKDEFGIEHGTFWQRPRNHYVGEGCRKCNKTAEHSDETVDSRLMGSWLGEKIVRNGKVVNSHIPMEWKCLKCCEIFPYFIGNLFRAKNTPCPRCRGLLKTKEEILKELKEKHGGVYTYPDFEKPIKRNSLIKVECKKHGLFFVTLQNHDNNLSGCPKCNMSKGEHKIFNWLTKNKFNFIYQKTFDDCKNPKTGRKYFFDFAVFINDEIILIEYDGIQHTSIDYYLRKLKLSEKEAKKQLKITKENDHNKNKYVSDSKNKRMYRINQKNFKDVEYILEMAFK